MKFFILVIFILLNSLYSQANTCFNYFNSNLITHIHQLSEQQYDALENLARFEIEVHKEKSPHLKRFKLEEFEDFLRETIELGIDLDVYYKVRVAVSKNESLKQIIVAERISQALEQQFAKTLEQKILDHFMAWTLTAALFKAFEDYDRNKEQIDLLFSHKFLIKKLDIHQTKPSTPNVIAVGSKKTFLHFAAEKDRVDILQYLLEQGADIETLNDKGLSPIFMAAKNNASNAVDFLWNQGARINRVDDDGNTLLHIFAQKGNDRHIEKFLRSSSKNLLVNTQGPFSNLLMKGVRTNGPNPEDLVNRPNKEGVTPLHLAVKNGHYSTFKTLLDNGGDIHRVTHKKETVFHLAALVRNFDIFRLLVDRVPYKNFDIDAVDIRGRTILHIAAANHLLEFVAFLISHKAQLNIRDKSNQTPLALSFGEVRDLLLLHEAKE